MDADLRRLLDAIKTYRDDLRNNEAQLWTPAEKSQIYQYLQQTAPSQFNAFFDNQGNIRPNVEKEFLDQAVSYLEIQTTQNQQIDSIPSNLSDLVNDYQNYKQTLDTASPEQKQRIQNYVSQLNQNRAQTDQAIDRQTGRAVFRIAQDAAKDIAQASTMSNQTRSEIGQAVVASVIKSTPVDSGSTLQLISQVLTEELDKRGFNTPNLRSTIEHVAHNASQAIHSTSIDLPHDTPISVGSPLAASQTQTDTYAAQVAPSYEAQRQEIEDKLDSDELSRKDAKKEIKKIDRAEREDIRETEKIYETYAQQTRPQYSQPLLNEEEQQQRAQFIETAYRSGEFLLNPTEEPLTNTDTDTGRRKALIHNNFVKEIVDTAAKGGTITDVAEGLRDAIDEYNIRTPVSAQTREVRKQVQHIVEEIAAQNTQHTSAPQASDPVTTTIASTLAVIAGPKVTPTEILSQAETLKSQIEATQQIGNYGTRRDEDVGKIIIDHVRNTYGEKLANSEYVQSYAQSSAREILASQNYTQFKDNIQSAVQNRAQTTLETIAGFAASTENSTPLSQLYQTKSQEINEAIEVATQKATEKTDPTATTRRFSRNFATEAERELKARLPDVTPEVIRELKETITAGASEGFQVEKARNLIESPDKPFVVPSKTLTTATNATTEAILTPIQESLQAQGITLNKTEQKELKGIIADTVKRTYDENTYQFETVATPVLTERIAAATEDALTQFSNDRGYVIKPREVMQRSLAELEQHIDSYNQQVRKDRLIEPLTQAAVEAGFRKTDITRASTATIPQDFGAKAVQELITTPLAILDQIETNSAAQDNAERYISARRRAGRLDSDETGTLSYYQRTKANLELSEEQATQNNDTHRLEEIKEEKKQLAAKLKSAISSALIKDTNSVLSTTTGQIQTIDGIDKQDASKIIDHSNARAGLVKQLEDELATGKNPERIQDLQDTIISLDRQFLSQNAQTITNIYKKSSIDRMLDEIDNPKDVPIPDLTQWTKTMREVYGQYDDSEQTSEVQSLTILQKSPTFIKSIDDDLSAGRLSQEDARTLLTAAADRQREIYRTFIEDSQSIKYPESSSSENWYDKSLRLENQIDQGSKEVQSIFEPFIIQQAGEEGLKNFFSKNPRYSIANAEEILANMQGWEWLDDQKYALEKEGKAYNPEELLKKVFANREMRNSQDYNAFLTDLGRQVISELNDVNNQDLKPEIIRRAKELHRKYFPQHEGTFEAFLSSSEFNTELDKVSKGTKLNTALTAAKIAPVALAQYSIEDNYDTELTKALFGYDPSNTLLDGKAYELTSQQKTRELVRDNQRQLLVMTLTDLGIREDQAKEVSDAVIGRVFGRMTLTFDEKRKDFDVAENWGFLGNYGERIKHYTAIQRLALEAMSPEQRERYFKENPDTDTQRLNFMVQALRHELAQELARYGININLDIGYIRASDAEEAKNLAKQAGSTEIFAGVKLGGKKPDIKLEKVYLLQQLLDNITMMDKEQVLKMMQEAENNREVQTNSFLLARSSYINKFQMWMNPRFAESRVMQTPLRVTSFVEGFMPWNRGKVDGFLGMVLFDPSQASKLYNIEFTSFIEKNFLEKRRGEIEKAIKMGQIPKDLDYFQKENAKRLIFQMKNMQNAARLEAKYPKLMKFARLKSTIFENTYVKFVNGVFTSGDPIGTSFKYIVNYGLNKTLTSIRIGGAKIFEIDPRTKQVVFSPTYQLKLALQARFDFAWDKYIRKPIIQPIRRKIQKTITRPLKIAAKRLVKAVLKAIFRTSYRAAVNFIKGALAAATVVGVVIFAAFKVLGWITNLPILRDIKNLIKYGIGLTIIAGIGKLFGFMMSMMSQVVSFGRMFLSGAQLFQGIGFALPGLGGAGAAGMLNGLLGNMIGVFGKGAAFMQGVTTGISLAGTLTLPAWVTTNAIPVVVGGSVGYMAFVEMPDAIGTFMTAFMDGPDSLTGLTSGATPTNPVQIRKEALAPTTGDHLPGGTVQYRITATAPACDKVFTMVDTLPSGLTYDPTVPASFATIDPNGPIESIQVTTPSPIPPNPITWTITLKDGSYLGPCTNATGIISGGAGDLRNWQYLTVDEIKALLLSPRIPQSPLRSDVDRYAQLIASTAQATSINPALILGIMYHEGGIGSNGPGMDAPPGDRTRTSSDVNRYGCRNLGNQRPGTIAWNNGAYRNNPRCLFGRNNNDEFAYYPSYDASITATFAVINSYLNRGLDTIEELANEYSPASDCAQGCARGAQFNREWKQTVSYTLRYKQFGNDGNIYEVGTSGGSNFAGFVTATLTYQAIIDPNIQNASGEPGKACLVNTASGEIGGSNGSTTLRNSTRASVSVGGEPCGIGDAPDNWIAVLCSDQYRICPTVSTRHAPAAQVWPDVVKQAVWNVVQKIYMSNTYWQASTQNIGLEVQRSSCWGIPGNSTYPLTCGGTTTGFHAGRSSYWQTTTIMPGQIPRITILTDAAVNSYGDNLDLWEWLIAHEIAHAASFGYTSPDGNGRIVDRDSNDFYTSINACSGAVSRYGTMLISENNAEVVSFYMTNGETAKSDYLGSSGNLRNDFLCHYNATKNGFFGGYDGTNYE